MKAKVILSCILALIAFGLFGYAIYLAIHYSSIGSPGSMPNFLHWAIVVIGGVLGTNLGAVLGTKVDRGRNFKLRLALFSEEPKLVIQMICAFFYVGVMLVVLIFWGKLGWIDDPTKIVDTLPMLSKTLIGVAIGAFTVMVKLE